MSEEPEHKVRSYTVGDVIELRLALTHEQHLESVWVIFGRDGGEDNTVTFEGEVEGTRQIEKYAVGDWTLPRKESTAVLRMAVDYDHRPGEYRLLRGGCRSVSNSVIHLRTYDPSGQGNSRFRIVEEPHAAPWADVKLVDEMGEPDEPGEADDAY